MPARDDRTRATQGNRGPAVAASSDERPRVRVVNPQRDNARTEESAGDVQRESQRADRDTGRGRSPEAAPPRAQQQERGAPTPSPGASKRPTFDRETRATPPPAPPAASAPRPQQPAERESARDRSREDTPPRAQPRPQQERRVQAPPPAAAERPIPPAPPPQARDRGGNGNNARIERQERRPAPKAEPRRDKARERPAADKKPERD